jgi:hypothetical protein
MLLLRGQGKLHDDDASRGGIWREKGNMDYWDNWRNRLNYSPRLNEQAGYTPEVVC